MKNIFRISIIAILTLCLIALAACGGTPPGDDGGKSDGTDGVYTPGEGPTFYISFVDEKGNKLLPDVPNDGQSDFIPPEAPKKPGYVFDGWYIYDSKVEGATPIAPQNVSVVGKYTPKEYFVEWYVFDELMMSGYRTVEEDWADAEVDDYMIAISTPDGFSADYFEFVHWCADEEWEIPFTDIDYDRENIKLYARLDYMPFEFTKQGTTYELSKVYETKMPDVLRVPATRDGINVTSIKAEVFKSITGLNKIILPDTITAIGDKAFSGCDVKSINVPAAVTSLGESVFKDCSALEKITIDSLADFDVEATFEGCTSIAYEEYGNAYYLGKYFMSAKSGEITSVEIRPGCESIPDDAFFGKDITRLVIPSSVWEIGARAFAGTKIAELTIPTGVRKVGSGAFSDCKQLVTVSLLTTEEINLASIFEGCTAIAYEEYGNGYYLGDRFAKPVSKDIVWAKIKPGCTLIPQNAFRDCTKLSRVFVPKSVKYVDSCAFYNVNSFYFACYFEGMNNSPTFRSGANSAGFTNPTTGQPLIYKFNTMPENVMMTDDGICYGYDYLPNYGAGVGTGTIVYAYFGDAETLVIPENLGDFRVAVIYPNAFMDNNTLKSVTVSACSVIGSAAFWNASALEEVILPEAGVSTIGTRAFYGCAKLESINLGTSGVVMIGKLAFEGCTSLANASYGKPLTAWSDDAETSVSHDAGENIAAALKGDEVGMWFFDSSYTKEQVQGFLSAVVQ